MLLISHYVFINVLFAVQRMMLPVHFLLLVISFFGIIVCQNVKYNPNTGQNFGQNQNQPLQQYQQPYGGSSDDSFYGSVSRYKQIEKFGSIQIPEDSYCPEHWSVYRSSCLRIYNSPRKDYLSAQKICQAYQGDLISVDNIEKHSFVLKLLDVDSNRNNRYYISTRQASPNNWINADKTQLVSLEDAFLLNAADENSYDAIFNKKPLEQYDSRRNFISGYNDNRNNLVYSFNAASEKWLFLPVNPEDLNLFICESQQLYSADNINLLADDQRRYDYGVDITDINKIPRGPYFIKQPRETTYDTGKAKITKDVMLSCLAGGYPTPTYSWFKEIYTNDNITVIRLDPLKNSRYTTSGGNLIIHDPQQIQDQGKGQGKYSS